jgi:hypothetical protein
MIDTLFNTRQPRLTSPDEEWGFLAVHRNSAYLSVKISAWGASDSQDLGYRHTRRAEGFKLDVHTYTATLFQIDLWCVRGRVHVKIKLEMATQSLLQALLAHQSHTEYRQ